MRRLAAIAVTASGIIVAGCDDDPDPPRVRSSAVEVVATGCRALAIRGEGLAVAPGRVLTVAHVVAGADSVTITGDAGTFDADVVALDPTLDLALLAVDESIPAIGLGTAQPGDRGAVVVHRDGDVVQLPVTVRRPVVVNTDDIHRTGTVARPGYEVTTSGTAAIEEGDSGAVVVVDGRAVAVVWSRSRRDSSRVWATDAMLIASELGSDAPVDTGACPPPTG